MSAHVEVFFEIALPKPAFDVLSRAADKRNCTLEDLVQGILYILGTELDPKTSAPNLLDNVLDDA
jgi:hypothetical protein